ncbi:uncharacterized protein LOC131976234 [Centropristis striata]|uniref:uncharacterized protein LOC131976234 n=1 Tax=Centropristis striata TaxID=184440 RepID=UPI0027DEE173|nr:uncharacterized protein LOC131976234 [Centropristis striata]
MMQKGFLFLLLVWNSSPFTRGNTTKTLRFSLGCQAVIPCRSYKSDSRLPGWFYQDHERTKEIKIYSKDNKGLDIYDQAFRHRIGVPRNGSLVIFNFTEDDQGFYWCQHCFQGNCWDKQQTVISVEKEILKETHETVYVIEGNNFTPACPGELINLKWTRPSNTSIHIGNVKSADAGNYICWKIGCNKHWQKLLTINLCVITVHNNDDSSVSCTVKCGVEFSTIKLNSTFNVETSTSTISVLVDSNGSLNCRAKQMFNGYSTVSSTHGPSTALIKTTDISTERGYLIPVASGTSAVFIFLIFLVILICYLRPRLCAALPVPLCCRCLNGRQVDEETSVVYSSVIIKTPAKTRDTYMTYSDNSCVYSEIKFERTIP